MEEAASSVKQEAADEIKQEEQERPESRDASEAGGDAESLAGSAEGSEQRPSTSSSAAMAVIAPPVSAEEARNTVRFKLLSPMGGRTLEFTRVRGIANQDAQDELMTHLTNIFKLGLGIKEGFERQVGMAWGEVRWTDVDQCVPMIGRLNKCISSVVSLWKGATRPHTESEWFQHPYCDAEQCKKLSFIVFNRVVKNAQILNKCYKSFSSLTYGETSFDQIQIILDRLQMTDKDVFVDLGSGVGHVVTFTAAYSQAKRCVGIEVNEVPALMANNMKTQFEGMMSWYGKKHRPFELIQGNFLLPKFKKLITEEATVIYINNFAFDAKLMFDIKQLILEMPNGTRIVCTKSLSEERGEERRRGAATAQAQAQQDQEASDGEAAEAAGGVAGGLRTKRPVSGRTLSRQAVDMMLDCEELPIADAPVSWSTGKGVQFLLFTVNHSKIEQIFQSAHNSSGSTSRSGSAENVAPAADDAQADNSISATIDEVVSARTAAAAGRPVRLFPDEDPSDNDDDEDYPAPGSRNRHPTKAEKRRTGRDDEYVPKKRSSTGASASRSHHKKDAKKDKPSTPANARRFGAAVETPMQRDVKVKKEEPVAGGASSSRRPAGIPDGAVILDPNNAMDAHLIAVRQAFMDFMTYLTTEIAKRRLMEEYHRQQMLKLDLETRCAQMVSTVEQLLNAGVQTLNCRLGDLDMTDAISPSDILNKSKQIVTKHKEVTIQVSAMESEMLTLERKIRDTVPLYAQCLIEKIDDGDFTGEDAYGVLISQAMTEQREMKSEEENELPVPQAAASNEQQQLLSPTAAATGAPARRQRTRPPRSSQPRRSGGAAATAAAAAAAAAAASTAQAAAGPQPAAKPENDEVERQIAEIVQKALQVDHVAKEKERKARSAAGLTVPLLSERGGDRKRSAAAVAAAAATAASAVATSTAAPAPVLPGVPTSTPVGAYAAAMMTAAEQLRYQLPIDMDYQSQR